LGKLRWDGRCTRWQRGTWWLGAIHNKLIDDSRYAFVNCLNDSGACGSQTYNSIVPLGDRSVGIIYQNGYIGPAASTWFMRIDLAEH